MACSNASKPPRLLLVGKTGTGKSATGNSILGDREFESKMSTESVTKNSKTAEGKMLGRPVVVTDMPGLADTELSDAESFMRVVKEFAKAQAANSDGFDAVLLVLELGRQSDKDKEVIAQVKSILSQSALQSNGILIITHGDEYDPDENQGKTFEQYCRDQGGLFGELEKEFVGRVLLMDNKTKDNNLKHNQLEKLHKMVDEIRKTSGPLTNDLTSLAKKGHDQLPNKSLDFSLTTDKVFTFMTGTKMFLDIVESAFNVYHARSPRTVHVHTGRNFMRLGDIRGDLNIRAQNLVARGRKTTK